MCAAGAMLIDVNANVVKGLNRNTKLKPDWQNAYSTRPVNFRT